MGNSLPHHRLSWLFLLGCPSLILIGIAIVSPPIRDHALALDDQGQVDPLADPYGISTLADAADGLSVTLSSPITLDIKPTSTGAFTKGDLSVTVSASNYINNYSLDMYALDPLTLNPTTALIDAENTNNTSKITTLPSNTTETNFTSNHWGYTTDANVTASSTYKPITTANMPLSSKTIPSTATSNTTSTDKVTFGVKVDNNIGSGKYSATLRFMTTATPRSYNVTFGTVTGISQVTLSNGSNINRTCTTALSNGGCTETLMYGSSYTITETASTGYTAKGWETLTGAGSIASSTSTSTTFTVGAGTATITPKAQANTYNVTIKPSTGISNVSITGTNCTNVTSTSGCTASLTYDQSYTISAAAATGYTFSSWSQSGTSGTLGSTTNASTTFKPGAGTTTLTASATINKYNITIKTATGISSVQLDSNTACTSSSGCTYSLEYGSSHTLKATASTGYTFSTWTKSSGEGTLSSATSATAASFTVGTGDATLTPSATINQYTCTKRYRLQNADGTWGDYQSDGTEQVNYNATCSYSKTVTDYKNSASGTNGAQASTSGTMTTSGITLSLDFYRNTFTLTVNKDSYISSASASTSAVHGSNYYRWGQSVNITATASTDNKFKNWTQTSGTTSSFGSTTTASTTFTMPKSAATIQANGETANVCPNGTSTFTDTRDGQSYRVATLSDGKCWMLDNLNLGGVDLQVSQLDNSNTNFSGTVAKATFNSWIVSTSPGSANSYTTPNIINQTGSDSNGSYNALYNYCAASMNTYCLASNTSTDSDTNGSRAISGDICPKGWRLPTGGSDGEWQALRNTYSSNSAFIAALKLPLPGRFTTGAPFGQGTYGYWWSSSRLNATDMYSLLRNGSTTSPARGFDRYYGLSIRCVFGS